MDEKKQKQIEEMAKIMCGSHNNNACVFNHEPCDFKCSAYGNANDLYNAGYRKVDSVTFVGGVVEQLRAEVIEEYRKKVYSKMEKYTVFGREYIQRIMREAEKEMKGGAE